MALGWPVSENGPMPGLPIRPVAKWQLMIASTLSVPCADWLTPCDVQVTVRIVAANHSNKVATPEGSCPVALAGARERHRKAAGVAVDIGVIERTRIGEMRQQPAEQRGVGSRRDGEK